YILIPPTTSSILFPYTTLFRSIRSVVHHFTSASICNLMDEIRSETTLNKQGVRIRANIWWIILCDYGRLCNDAQWYRHFSKSFMAVIELRYCCTWWVMLVSSWFISYNQISTNCILCANNESLVPIQCFCTGNQRSNCYTLYPVHICCLLCYYWRYRHATRSIIILLGS